MDEIKQTQAKMQEKIGKLQEEVAANQDDVVQKIVKKLKVDHGYTTIPQCQANNLKN